MNSTRFRLNLSGANGSAVNTAGRAFSHPASYVATAVPSSAQRSGTRPQNTAGLSGNAITSSRVNTNIKKEKHTEEEK